MLNLKNIKFSNLRKFEVPYTDRSILILYKHNSKIEIVLEGNKLTR